MTRPLLDVDSLSVVFRVPVPAVAGERRTLRTRHAEVRAVDSVSFTIAPGETLGLVGESGSGKSTIAGAVMRLVESSSGSITLDGESLSAARGAALTALRRRIAMVHQDPMASLNPRRTIAESVREPLDVHGLHRGRRRERVLELLELVGLDARFADRYPRHLSGGQRQRVCIARALASDPELIILDEATASLDVSVQAQILNLLQRLQREHNLAYLFIAHDLAVVEHMSSRVMVLYLGRVMELADRDALFPKDGEGVDGAGAGHPYTQALLSAIPPADPLAESGRERVILSGDVPSPLNPPSGCVFRTRCPLAIDQCGEVVPPPLPVAPGHEVHCIRVGAATTL
ncbi:MULTISPECIES: oligopeptide/dipeptide ABC transporter ATP-binding protein [Microcella]|uniref:ABC transporter ATP-binding protein n=1 Tax=Microcella TaxID=337004 RepID=UPI0015CEFC53|nr:MULTISPECIES: oligopeptide/dipeptide ABC transporter ATP-binding protein [Microcella]QOD94980.1 ATP-binding cassette domain-containing protein [Chryseoglobus sp. 28M-23]